MNKLIDSYYDWLKENTILNVIGDYTEVTTPFLDRHNDCILLYLKKLKNNNVLITDDGYTLSDLEDSGFNFNSARRKKLLENILINYNLSIDKNNAITTHSSIAEFPIKKHFYIQGILSINDLFVTNRPNVASLFIEDVTALLDNKGIIYTSDIKITGKSGYNHNIDFLFPTPKAKPEKYLKLVNTANKNSTEINLFAWNDIKDIRKADSKMFVLVNDIDNKIKEDTLTPYYNYDIKPMLWSEKDELIKELTA